MDNARPCPVCGSLERQHLHRQRFEDGSLGTGYDVVVCQKCGAGFADGVPEQQELDLYYTEQSRYSYDSTEGMESDFDLRRFRTTFDQLVQYIKPSFKILDIGCATGGLLSIFKAEGYSQCTGIDPSEVCVAAARRIHGIDARRATFSDLDQWTEKFDLILLLGVLEHIRETKKAVQAAARLLNPGGMIYAAVPDVTGLTQSRNAPFQQFSMEHLNFFSGVSLNNLFSEVGFTAIQCWRWTLDWRERVTEPVVSGLFQKSPAAIQYKPDLISRQALLDYVTVSAEADERLTKMADELVRDEQPLFIWGTGALLRRMLISTRLRYAKIVGFVDSSVSQQGKLLLGLEILSPEHLVGRNEPILICSIAFQEEILSLIRDRFKLRSPVLVLPL